MGRQTDRHFARIQFVVAYSEKDVRERKFRGRSLFESKIIIYYPIPLVPRIFFSFSQVFAEKHEGFYPWLHYMMTQTYWIQKNLKGQIL